MREQLLADLPVSERRLEVEGVETAVLEGGEGPPIVLLHGVASFAPEWGRVIPQLVGNYRVVAPDSPGLGESGVPVGRLDAAVAVAWLKGLIARTSWEDGAREGAAIQSVGTRTWIVLLTGRDGDDPLLLQVKEAGPSVLEPYTVRDRARNHGQRVVQGQRLMQVDTASSSDG